jgi:hypothetical protein
MSAGPVFYGNVHFCGVARVDRGEGIVIASHSHNTETQLDGVKQVLQQPNMQMQPGKHYSFSAAGNAWHLISDDDGLIYILIAKATYQQRLAYAALEELQKKFSSKYKEKAGTAKARSLDRVANPILMGVCTKYDNVAEVDRLASVNRKVESVKLVMQENVDMALQNTVKLESLEKNAEDLQQQAGVFRLNAIQLKKKMWWKKIKMQIIVGLLILGVLGGLVGMIVYLTDDKKDS